MKRSLNLFWVILLIAGISACKPSNTIPVAKSNTLIPCVDADGNVYPTVTIGKQVWMVQNLKTRHFRNGEAIPTGLDSTTWFTTMTSACASYGDSTACDIAYGKLYNWFAVVDKRNICPKGWHIPTHDEWLTLINYLGGPAEAGSKMKSTSKLWELTRGHTNSSGFSVLPSGFRSYNGHYEEMGLKAMFWTCTLSNNTNPWFFGYSTYSPVVNSGTYCTKQEGFSIRCVKD